MPHVQCDGCGAMGPVVITAPKWRREPRAIVDGWVRNPQGDHFPRDSDYREARQLALDAGWATDNWHPGHDVCPACRSRGLTPEHPRPDTPGRTSQHEETPR